MATIKLPYGKAYIEATVRDDRLKAVLESHAHEFKPTLSETEIVREAMDNPIASQRLHELAKNKKNIVVIASDHTRPVPSKIIMPLMLADLRKGNPDCDITILISTGSHRTTTKQELIDKFGEEICKKEKIIVHDCTQDNCFVKFGTLPSGGEFMINRVAAEADLLVSEGFIEPHFFAGFSGGRKSVLPGVTSRTTVLANHCAEFIADDNARAGILDGNPIHKDMIYGAEKAKLVFIVNVVIDADKKVISAFAGHYNEAHRAGCEFVAKIAGVKAVKSDIVITTNGGYPLDQNIYQAVKSMTAAEASINGGGVIIIAAQCEDGHGGDAFYETFANDRPVSSIMERFLKTPRNETIPDQWQSQIFARVLLKHRVIMVTDAPESMVADFRMLYAKTIEEAVAKADEILRKPHASITVIPDGVSVIVLE